MKWFSRAYWWNLLMGGSKNKPEAPVENIKRGRPKGSTNKPKVRKKKNKVKSHGK